MIADGNIGLTGRDQFRWIIGIGRCHQFDVEIGRLEKAALLGDDQCGMIRIDEPVEQDGDLVGGLGGHGCRDQGEGEKQADHRCRTVSS